MNPILTFGEGNFPDLLTESATDSVASDGLCYANRHTYFFLFT